MERILKVSQCLMKLGCVPFLAHGVYLLLVVADILTYHSQI